jgi:putative membrane protein
MMYGYGGIWIVVGLIALALFVALIVALVVVAVSAGRNRGQSMQSAPRSAVGSDDPLEILRRRYAKGEITREEYQSMREDLTG